MSHLPELLLARASVLSMMKTAQTWQKEAFKMEAEAHKLHAALVIMSRPTEHDGAAAEGRPLSSPSAAGSRPYQRRKPKQNRNPAKPKVAKAKPKGRPRKAATSSRPRGHKESDKERKRKKAGDGKSASGSNSDDSNSGSNSDDSNSGSKSGYQPSLKNPPLG